jgi:hypothetical protein
MGNLRISAYSPDGKQHFKSLNTTHYTPDEINLITLAFKRHIQTGKKPKDFNHFNAIKKPTTVVLPDEKPMKAYMDDDSSDSGSSVSVGMGSHFERRSLDTLELPENKAMSFCCIGSTRSGKTYALNYIWNKIFKKHITVLMTLSGHADIYKGYKNTAIISDGFHKELIEEPMKINKDTNNHYNFCLIFDDLAMEGKISNSMTKLLTIGRNSGMSAIISGQKMTMLSSTGRTNINFVLCFKQNTETAIEDTIKTFLRSYFPRGMKMSEMISMYKDITQDHNFFCIDTLNDRCFISKI